MFKTITISPSANTSIQPSQYACPWPEAQLASAYESLSMLDAGCAVLGGICRRRLLTHLILVALCITGQLNQAGAQTTADFENIPFSGNQYLANAGASGVFEDGHVALVNSYEPAFQAWEGWALSRVTDNMTQGFSNQYACIVGAGEGASQTYAVSYAYNPAIIRLTGAAKGGTVTGMFVTNSTYAYYAMLNGDAFSKRFGGATGTDPDFFLLTVKGWLNGQLKPDSVNYYLADYRFANSNDDYILKSWAFMSLTGLGAVDSLSCTLSSSDVGAFGMNTPAYFCMDKITTLNNAVATNEVEQPNRLALYPNPARQEIFIADNGLEVVEYAVFDALGREVLTGQANQNRLDISQLEPGVYVLSINGQFGRFVKG